MVIRAQLRPIVPCLPFGQWLPLPREKARPREEAGAAQAYGIVMGSNVPPLKDGAAQHP